MKITEKNVNPKFEPTESNLKKFDLTELGRSRPSSIGG